MTDRTSEQRVLGGRSDVYVLDDIWGVTAAALVFKPTTMKAGQYERDTARELTAAVKREGLQTRFATFRSLALVELEVGDKRRSSQVDCVHVMRRENGTALSDIALQSALSAAPVDEALLGKVLQYLALFHAVTGCGPQDSKPASRRDLRNKLKMWLTEIAGRAAALGSYEHFGRQPFRILLRYSASVTRTQATGWSAAVAG